MILKSLKKCKTCLEFVHGQTYSELPSRDEVEHGLLLIIESKKNQFILTEQGRGLYKKSLKKCETCLEFVEGQTYSELPSKDEFEGTLYSLKGNAHFAQESYQAALECYEEDLSIAKAWYVCVCLHLHKKLRMIGKGYFMSIVSRKCSLCTGSLPSRPEW